MKFTLPTICIQKFSSSSLFSQNRRTISGKVIEKGSRQPLIGVNAIVQGTDCGTATDTTGYFIIENLEPDSYNLSFFYLGYKTILKSNIIVNPRRTTFLEIMMETDVLQGEAVDVSATYLEKPKEAVVSPRHNIREYRHNDDGTRERVLQFEVFPVGGVVIEF